MLSNDKITNIFCLADDFCKIFNSSIRKSLLPEETTLNKRNRKFKMSDSEVMTILILFHLSGYRCLKHFYLYYVCVHLKNYFPNTVSYNRFTELQQKVILPLSIFLKEVLTKECTGITFVDSTPLRVCKNQRIHNHKTFKGLAERRHSSMGWFYGFKLHLICNDKGELLNFVFTKANVDDRKPLEYENFMKGVKGKLFGDKGYISMDLFNKLFVDGIQLITKIKNNMKNCLMTMSDKILLRKRAIIETINDELKNMCQIEHSRHRSFGGFFTNLIAGLSAYCFFPKKPSLKIKLERSNQLTLC